MSSSWTDTVRRGPGTFAFRLGLWYAVLFVAGGAVLTVLTYLLLASALERRDHELIVSALDRYAARYARAGLAGLQAEVASDPAGRHESLMVQVRGPLEEALFLSGPAMSSDLEVATAQLPDGTLLQIGKSTEVRRDILRRFRAQAFLILLAVGAIGLAGGVLLTRPALAPLQRLSDALAAIVRTGQVSARVPVRGQDDPLDQLSRSFNQMLDRIETLIAGLRGSLDNVAHDLRTPLARLRAALEGAVEARGEEALRGAISDALEESDRVAAMLTTLMDISEAETGTMALDRAPVEVAAVLAEVRDLYEDTAEAKDVHLTLEPSPGLVVQGDRRRLVQAVANLVDNAIKYTPAGGHVALRARAEPPRIVLEVRDDGAGIPAADLPRIWERLYRGDHSRSERGLGLGLSLVRAIARAHGGDAAVESAPGQGSMFRLTLPAPASLTRM
jgi:signal transduction histidine kinase